MAVKTKIKDLAIGSEFNAGPATLRILDHLTDGTQPGMSARTASTGDEWAEREF